MKPRHAGLGVATPVCLLLLIGCEGKSTTSNDASPAPSATSSAAPETETDRACRELKATFRTVLAEAEMRCTTDSDCSCSPGGIQFTGCGRVVNRQSANKLYGIYEQIRKQCGLDFNCAPKLCRAACQGGGCVERLGSPDEVKLPELEK